MAEETKYKLVLTIEGKLTADQKDDLADAMAGEASSVLCDMRGGDSGSVKVEFAR